MNPEVLAEFLGPLVRSSLQAGVLVVVVLLIRTWLGRSLAPRWRCALWLLVLVRLGWPFELPSPVSVFNVFHWTPRQWGPDHVPFYLAGELAAQAGTVLSHPVVVGTWLVVTGALLLRAAGGALWLYWKLRRARPVDSWEAWWLLHECKEVSGLQIPVAILESDHVKSPCLLGFFRTRLLLPRGFFEELTRDEIRLVFLHELAHVRRRDLLLNWLLLLAEIVHWFNPLVRLCCRHLRADREEACDAFALAAEPGRRRAYGEVVLKLLERFGAPGRVPLLAAFLGDGDPLTRRIRAIAGFDAASRTWIVGACTCLAVALIGLTDSAAGPASEETRAALDDTIVPASVELGAPQPAAVFRSEGERDRSGKVTRAGTLTSVESGNGRRRDVTDAGARAEARE